DPGLASTHRSRPERRSDPPERARRLRRRTRSPTLGPVLAEGLAVAAATWLDRWAQQPWQSPGRRRAGQLVATPAGRGSRGTAAVALSAATRRPRRATPAHGAAAGLAAPGPHDAGGAGN